MFEIFGISFHWYGLLIGLGTWIAMEISLAGRGKIKKATLEQAIFWAVISGVIGARLYHVIDYWNRYYAINPLKIFFVWEGGLGIWGAIGGGIVGLLLFCHFNKSKFLDLLDPIVIGVPLAQAIGRVGNYLNGELAGKNGEPLFAYEGGLNIILFVVLLALSQKKRKTGFISGIYFVGYGMIRVALENLRPTENIWKILNIPVAIIIGLIAIFWGSYLIFRRKQS